MSENLKTIGTILEGPQHRDAIHMAVAPVVSAKRVLRPCNHVGVNEKGEAGDFEPYIGIVDPFLKVNVKKGEQFWLFLYPGSITTLRHHWEHPAFAPEVSTPVEHVPPPEAVKEMKALIKSRDYMKRSYDEVMLDADVYYKVGRETEYNDRGSIEDEEKFWDLYEKIRGVKVDPDKRVNFYVCCI